MKDVQKMLSAQEKAQLITAGDNTLSDAVKSVRRKMISENYLTSVTQVATLDRLLQAVKDNENSSLAKVLFEKQVMNKQIELLRNILDMFKEGWMLSKVFRAYAGSDHVKEINAWKVKDIVRVIETKDRSRFEQLGLFKSDKAPVKPQASKPARKKPYSKPRQGKPQTAGQDVPVIVKS